LCTLSTKLFVQPSVPRSAPEHATSAAVMDVGMGMKQPSSMSMFNSVSLLGLGMVGAVGLAAKRAPKVSRQFFGGPSTPAYKAFDPADEAGVQDPVGFWDPLGLAEDKDEATFKRRRAVEIKHGRVCMYATIGYIVPEYFKFPGYLSPSEDLKFADVPNGLAAISKVPLLGWLQILFFAGFIETSGFFSGSSKPIGFMQCATQAGTPGDYGVGFPNFIGKVEDPEAKASKLNAELANGRLAMVAIIGMFFQDGLTGSAWGDWALYTASPLRAFENELGVQPPVGFWDPAGFTSDGDAQEFYRRRCVELKHGRVSMLACIGYIVPEYFKFPGYLAPSIGLKFEDVPHGIAALTKVPALGWTQIVLFGLSMELFAASQNPEDPPGKLSSRLVIALTEVKDWPNNYTFGPYGIPNAPSIADPEIRKKKLNAELANGRLAMFAIMAMLFQNGTVGTTGPEMWLPQA